MALPIGVNLTRNRRLETARQSPQVGKPAHGAGSSTQAKPTSVG